MLCIFQIALLTANASQLKNLFETENHPNFQLCMGLLVTSIVLQIIVAILLLVVARMDYQSTDDPTVPRKRDTKAIIALNDISTVGIFMITVVNIFIASFISHGKAYIPTVNAESSYHEKIRLEKMSAELNARNNASLWQKIWLPGVQILLRRTLYTEKEHTG